MIRGPGEEKKTFTTIPRKGVTGQVFTKDHGGIEKKKTLP
jgi:hypothetical protein